MSDETERKPTLHSIMSGTLNDYRLSNMVFKGTDDPYNLVDLLSNNDETATVHTGKEEIERIVDQLALDLVAQAPDTSTGHILEVLDADGTRSASLNLEGAIDTLLIANGMSESDTVIRTLRRVLGQVDETIRLAQIGTARTLAD